MDLLLNLLHQYGLLIVFINVFLEQIGLPLPAYPTILIASAISVNHETSLASLMLVAVVGALLADMFWYFAGRRYGKKVMSKLCKISLSPDSCVKQTESMYLKVGPSALLFCKFVPGFASISSALAGALGTKSFTFIVLDGIGAAIWVGTAVLLGSMFSASIDQLLLTLVEMGKWGALVIALAFVLFVANKWWERYRFLKALRMARISVDALNELLVSGKKPVIIDTRPPKLIEDGWIPSARFVSTEQVKDILPEIDISEDIVLYCACPNEVTAAKVAKAFMNHGYFNVRPLAGGIDAWIESGFDVHKPADGGQS